MTHDVHESAVAHVTGSATYSEDLGSSLPGALHAWPVQARQAHAELAAIDASAALRMPGVRAVLTADDVPGVNDTGSVRHDEPLLPRAISYFGQPVAWVLADSLDLARAAADCVRLDTRELPAIVTLRAAIEAGSYHTEQRRIVRGDAEAAIADAPRRLGGELDIGGQEHFYLETQAALARRDEAGLYHVLSSTQHPTETQAIVAHVLGVARNRVICESLRMGGGFGGKETQSHPIAAIAALGLHVTGRPVCVRLDRRRDMSITGKRHPFLARYQVGFDDDGRVSALDVELTSDGGYSLDLSEAILWRALFHSDNAYDVPNMRVVGRVARTHLPSNTAMRGFGGPQGMLVVEDALARVALATGLPAHVVRERNFYREGSTTHYGQPVRDAGRIARIWQELKLLADFDQRLTQRAQLNALSPHEQRGIALTPVKFGISFTARHYNQAGALVLVYRDGSVQVNHGGTEMGQGLHTKIRNVAARTLGVSPDAIATMSTRTDKVPNTSATAASSGSDLNGAAVQRACETLRARITPFAAELLGCAPDEVSWRAGVASAANGVTAPFAAAVERAYLAREPLFATGHYATPDLAFDPQLGQGKPFHYFAYGAAVCDVAVDCFTGQYRLLRVDVLHDVGDSLAPAIDRGQIEGGFVQGLGWLTCEEVAFDARGALLTRGASTYKLPGAGDAPPDFRVHMLERATEPGVVYGSKAVGEPPFMLALSVREALRDAIACARGGGDVQLASPASPEAVLTALRACGRGRG